MAFLLTEGAEPIPGYQLVRKLGTGGYGEVWQVTAPGGLTKAVKVIYGHQRDARAEQELRALSRIKEVRHPFLLSLERFEVIQDQVFIVTELADGSLMDRFEECRRQGLTGIPRGELLGYLRDAADALDYMNEHYGLQHLDIKPQNLLLVAGRVKIADFGLVKDLQGTSATATGGVTPVYASPEAFDGKVSRYSDQYSLAIVFQELLTGIRPFPGKTALQLAAQHMNSPPLLDPLPAADRAVIGRALAKLPDHRFRSCREMVGELLRYEPAAPPPAEPAGQATPDPVLPPVDNEPTPEDGVLEMDTVVSPELPPRAAVRPRPLPPTPAVRPEAPADSTPLPDDAGAGRRPTLFLGVGGLAGRTLGRLRRRLSRRFGDLSAVPALRLLLLDTDRAELRRVQQAEPGEAFRPDEVCLLPLGRPEHYRSESRLLLRWLDRRWLYGIPRSLRTEGMRPFGRLALVDHVSDVLARVQEALGAICSPEARAAARAAGLDVRADSPRVFVVASISGGTGSASAIDLGYAVRQVLADLGIPDDGLCAVLLHAAGFDPTRRDLARVNAYAALTEWGHFGRPDAAYPGDPHHGLAPWPAGKPPFEETYLVHLGDQLADTDADAATDSVAEYLYMDAVTPAGGLLDRLRRETRATSASAGPELRTFGLHRISFPRHALAAATADRFTRRLVEGWLEGGRGGTPPNPDGEVQAKAAALGLTAAALEKAFTDAARDLWSEEPAAYLAKVAAEAQAAAADGSASAAEAPARLLTALDQVFGPGAARAADGEATALERALADTAEALGRRLTAATRDWLVGLLDEPARRVPAASAACAAVARHLQALEETMAGRLAECRLAREALRRALALAQPAGSTSGIRSLAGLKRTEPRAQRSRPLEYCDARFRELLVESTLAALRPVGREIPPLTQQLDLLRQRLRYFADAFAAAPAEPPPTPGLTRLWPGQAGTLAEAADELCRSIERDSGAEFEQRVRLEVLRPLGGMLALCSLGREGLFSLREELRSRALAAAAEAGQDLDAAQLFIHASGDPAEALARHLRAAAPRLAVSGARSHRLVAVPDGWARRPVGDLLRQADGDVPATLVESDGDIVLCHEVSGLSVAKAASALIDHEGTYTDLARRVLSRVDVSWTPLPLVEA